ncbi:hypothetical protein EB001_06935 [bacterium]|nr:hypothetical protein [bacterium]
MATTTSLTTTYAGQDSKMWVKAAILSGNTLANGGMTIMPNIAYKSVLHKLSTDGLLKDASCDFTATSTVTITERTLTLEPFQVNLQLCKKDHLASWQSEEMGYSANKVLAKSFADYLLAYVAEKVANSIEVSIWNGANATTGQIDGIMTLLTADANLPAANEVAGTTVTAANVIAELGKIVDAIPAALYGKDDLKLYVSQNIAKLYVRALGGFGASGLGANGTDNKGTQWYTNGTLTFDGIPLFVANGLTANQAIAAQTSNLFFGCGLLNDTNEISVLDMKNLDGSDNVRIIMRAAYAVNYHSPSDIVTYGITNSAN